MNEGHIDFEEYIRWGSLIRKKRLQSGEQSLNYKPWMV